MKKRSLLYTLLTVAIAAAAAAVIAYLVYRYRDSICSAFSRVKEKGRKLLNTCCEDFSDFADL